MLLLRLFVLFLVTCPICSTRIAYDNLDSFVNSLISHGTLATMVEQYLRTENNYHRCHSCQDNYIDVDNVKLCRKCEIKNENIKKQIKETMTKCEDILFNEKLITLEKINEERNHLYNILNQRTTSLLENIDKYYEELENLLTEQQKINEMNA